MHTVCSFFVLCVDADYFRSCLDHYSNDAVERVTEKMMDCGGYYPQIPSYDSVSDNRLNACLRLLALEIFPDCDIGFLRERVLRYTCAHVENVTEELLKLARWPERLNYGKMDRSEGIHGQRYKDQAQAQLVKDFPQVRKKEREAGCVDKEGPSRFGNLRFKPSWPKTIGII